MENLKDELTLLRADHEAKEVNFTHTEASLRSEVSTADPTQGWPRGQGGQLYPQQRPLFLVR
jgi:hypothetical protein